MLDQILECCDEEDTRLSRSVFSIEYSWLVIHKNKIDTLKMYLYILGINEKEVLEVKQYMYTQGKKNERYLLNFKKVRAILKEREARDAGSNT